MNELVSFKFDIYERIKLDRSEREIKEIFTTELKPFVTAVSDGDYVELVGSLVLKVEYFSVVAVPSFELIHHIPIEIRIPANRLTKGRFVEANVINFDVEHVGAYVLNLTGKLEITEVEPESLDLPKAPETTASPSKAAADKGILTEEELKEIQASFGFFIPDRVVDLFNSHRELFKANAELSFKNGKFKEAMLNITQSGEDSTAYIKSYVQKVLEELK